MSIIDFYKNRYIKKVIQASEALDTLVYLNAPSFESAVEHWILDLAKELKVTVEKYKRIDYEVVADKVLNINEKILENKNIEYLNYLEAFRKEVDYVIARKSLQYAKICAKRDKANKKSNAFKNSIIYQEGKKYLEQLDIALNLINKFSDEHLKRIKKQRLDILPKYQNLYSRLNLFKELTSVQFLKDLIEKGEI